MGVKGTAQCKSLSASHPPKSCSRTRCKDTLLYMQLQSLLICNKILVLSRKKNPITFTPAL